MDIPQKVFDELPIKKGTIIKTKGYFAHRKDHPKYFIVLNKEPHDNPLVCAITTSDINFYLRNPKFNEDILSVAAKVVHCFPVDTVVDCRQIYPFSRERIKEFFAKGDLSFEGEFSKDLMEKIEDIIKASRFITKTDKRKILPEDHIDF